MTHLQPLQARWVRLLVVSAPQGDSEPVLVLHPAASDLPVVALEEVPLLVDLDPLGDLVVPLLHLLLLLWPLHLVAQHQQHLCHHLLQLHQWVWEWEAWEEEWAAWEEWVAV